jgi:hypothetical protein
MTIRKAHLTELGGLSRLPVKMLLLGLLVLVLLTDNPRGYAAAQDQDGPAQLEVATPNLDEGGEGGQFSQSTSTPSAPGKVKEKSAHCGAIVIAPFPIVSPAIGSGVIPVLGYIFPFSKDDTIPATAIVCNETGCSNSRRR